MNRWEFMALALALLLAFVPGLGGIAVEAPAQAPATAAVTASGQIYLYGEMHGEKVLLDKELALWKDHYDAQGMRHLFVEMPYYAAAFLNLWMQADSDEILLALYMDTEGTASHVPDTLTFYRQIKAECPETVFHGTDVGHQYDTTGARFLAHLQENGMQDSEPYRLAQEAIAQGQRFYSDNDFAYRENAMVENFIRAFDSLGGESIMGIYGGAHTNPQAMDYNTGTVESMAMQLARRYGDALHTEDLYWLLKAIDPIRQDEIVVGDKAYAASYFGREDLTGFADFTHRDFWRLEDAYADFKDNPTNGDVLPYDNYPMQIEPGEVFIVDIDKTDGSTMRLYFRSDGNLWEGMAVTEQFLVE